MTQPPPPPSRPEEAHASFSQSGQLDTRDSSTYPADLGNRIAVTHAQLGDLYLAVNQAAEAAKHYEAAVHVRPRFMDIRAKFAESLIGEQAKAELEVILESRPAFVGARLRLGVVLQRVGDLEGAVREWKQCAIDDPQDMRPRAYLASAGVTFPRVHRGEDQAASAAGGDESIG